jgi:Aldo/keto reductase family
MSMTGGYSDKPDRQEMISLIHAAVDRGVTFFDTAEIYGSYADEELVGGGARAVSGKHSQWGIEPLTYALRVASVSSIKCSPHVAGAVDVCRRP